jgi:hypothetical protein
MLISYYEDGTPAPKRTSHGMAVLMGANVLFAAAILFAWTYVALFVAEPLAWATWMPIHRGYGLAGALEYPFVVLWLLPLIGVGAAWVSLKAGQLTLAYACVAVPLVMLLLVLGWFHLAPADWH